MSRQQIQKPTTALNYDENNSGSIVVNVVVTWTIKQKTAYVDVRSVCRSELSININYLPLFAFQMCALEVNSKKKHTKYKHI